MAKDSAFFEAKRTVIENIEAIQVGLAQCVNEGMIDAGDYYYNQLLSLLDEATIANSWDELMEVVGLAKVLEIDVVGWQSRQGRTTLSLPWPKKPAS